MTIVLWVIIWNTKQVLLQFIIKQTVGINISCVNPDHISNEERTTPEGFKINYVECSIDELHRQRLFEKLKRDYHALHVCEGTFIY